MIAYRPKKAGHGFLDAAFHFGAEYELVGRLASGLSSPKTVQSHEPAGCSPSEGALTGTEEKRRTSEEREREMFALAKAHILTCGDFLPVQDLANHLGIHLQVLSPALKEWEADRRIFSINHDGCIFFQFTPSQRKAEPVQFPALRMCCLFSVPRKAIEAFRSGLSLQTDGLEESVHRTSLQPSQAA
ncbi:hypothetical protein [Pseudomonas violetae]|uniref:Uncharacterized protein n=1 Tax=Pseudomonas violetae TaxID=2915813 RepID=A0ABT0EZC9_9PSED|nr:hypothetical protein [Pseudomonas violetae]MCK1791115.1 hypothetical protein [Pseudomonas violetae]